MVVAVVGRRRWWRVVIVVVVIVVCGLRRRLGCRLLHWLDDSGVAAGKRQHGCAAEKESCEGFRSNHSVVLLSGAAYGSSVEMQNGMVARRNLAHSLVTCARAIGVIPVCR